MDIGHVLFRPNGRIGQQDYWIGILILVVANLLIGITGPLYPIFWLGLIWVGLAVYGKRLHDAGKTAWYHALVWGLSLVLGGIGVVIMVASAISAGIISDSTDLSTDQIIALVSAGGFGLLLIGASNLVWIIYTLWVGFLKGDAGENAYGSPPAGDAATAATASAASGSAGAPLEGEITRTDAPGDGPKS